MAEGYTPIPKLQVEDLGTEGTGDRIALFDSNGKLVGYILKDSIVGNFVPLSGTEEGKPITGDLEFSSITNKVFFDDGTILRQFSFSDENAINLENISDENDTKLYIRENGFEINSVNLTTGYAFIFVNYIDSLSLSSNYPGFKGLVGNRLYDKQNDPNAFAQLGDINILKEYVDDELSAKQDGNIVSDISEDPLNEEEYPNSFAITKILEYYVNVFGDQDNIEGIKKFLGSVRVKNPTDNDDAVPLNFLKDYVKKSKSVTITEDTLFSPDDFGNKGILTVFVDTTAGNVTINLSSASITKGLVLKVIKKTADANKVIIDGSATETINGQPTQEILLQYGNFTIESDGVTNYLI